MIVYYQHSGQLFTQDGRLIGSGYSGKGQGKNNPALEATPFIGPIPRGRYTIGGHIDSPSHGPFTLPLTPVPSNNMFGRDHFLVHGDSPSHPGEASEGCIILPRAVREWIEFNRHTILEVVV